MGVQGPPYRSDVYGHKNARHGFLAGFPAAWFKKVRHCKCTIKNEVAMYDKGKNTSDYLMNSFLQDSD